MRQRTRSALVQVMACRLFGTKPLPEPMLDYCELDSCEQISVKFKSFSLKKLHLKLLSDKMAAILSRGDELISELQRIGLDDRVSV